MLSVLTTLYAQLIAIVLGAVLGLLLYRTDRPSATTGATHAGEFRVTRAAGAVALALFCALLFALPAVSNIGSLAISVFDAFYRSGALVFGGAAAFAAGNGCDGLGISE